MPIASALLNVLIYSGPGTCDFSVKQTLKTLKKFLNHSYDVKLISSEILKNEMIPWDENCALFVVPGGRDLPYVRDFNGKSMQRMKSQIEEGKMSYLGICAGAYFATDRIEFSKGSSDGYEIIQERPMKLIKCTAIGPIGKFFYSDDPLASETEIKGSLQAIDVKVGSEDLKFAYNGGCYFESADPENVLADYSSNGKPAIIKGKNVCLSGVHLEYDAVDCLKENGGVFLELLKYENQRKILLKRILKDLGLIVNESKDDSILEEVRIYTRITGLIGAINANVIVENDPALPEYKNIPNLLYSVVTTSTQTILQSAPNFLDSLPNYSVYVADHQVNGKGRSDNFWISSPACLQFTVKVEHLFGKANQLPLIQFLMALSVAECINSQRNSSIEAKIKWPNDVYLYGGTSCIGKVSGILVNCVQSHNRKAFQVLIGVGINLLSDPSLPNITHLNDHLSVKFGKEEFLLELLERFKYYHDELMNFDRFPFENYHSNWLHTGQMIQSKDFPDKYLKIKGIDEFGYLIAEEMGTRQIFKFEPDGNSFDMMKNLIQRK